MDDNLEGVAKEGQRGLVLLTELSSMLLLLVKWVHNTLSVILTKVSIEKHKKLEFNG